MDEVVKAMEEATGIPRKRLEESMLLSKAWRNPSLTPLPLPRFPICASQHCKKNKSIVRATSAFHFWRRRWTLALACTITSLVILRLSAVHVIVELLRTQSAMPGVGPCLATCR